MIKHVTYNLAFILGASIAFASPKELITQAEQAEINTIISSSLGCIHTPEIKDEGCTPQENMEEVKKTPSAPFDQPLSLHQEKHMEMIQREILRSMIEPTSYIVQ